MLIALDIAAIIGESPMGSQSAAASKSAGLAIGLVATSACLLDLPIEFCTPDSVKKAVTGRKDASKDDIMDRAIELYGGSKTVKAVPITKGRRAGKAKRQEHPEAHQEALEVDTYYPLLHDKWRIFALQNSYHADIFQHVEGCDMGGL